MTATALWSVPAVAVVTAAPAFASSLDSVPDVYVTVDSPMARSSGVLLGSGDELEVALTIGNRGGVEAPPGVVLALHVFTEDTVPAGVWSVDDPAWLHDRELTNETAWVAEIDGPTHDEDQGNVVFTWSLPAIGAGESFEITIALFVATIGFPFLEEGEEDAPHAYASQVSLILPDGMDDFDSKNDVVLGPAFELSRRPLDDGDPV